MMRNYVLNIIYHFVSLYILLLLLFVSNQAQNPFQDTYPIFDRIQVEDGLPSNEINCTIEDKHGFIWMGTANGLCRYDGSNFKLYQYHASNSNNISGNVIRALHEDPEGFIWVGTTGGGLNRLDPITDQVEIYKHDPLDPNSISCDEILCIYTDKSGRLWIGTERGLNLFHPEEGTFTSFMPDIKDPNSLGAEAIISILEDNKGNIWVGAWAGGLNLLLEDQSGDPKKIKFKTYYHDPKDPYSIPNNDVWKIFEDNGGRIWISCPGKDLAQWIPVCSESGENLEYISVSYEIKAESGEANNVTDINQDKNGFIWLSSYNGIWAFDPSSLPNEVSKPNFIKNEITYRHFACHPNNIYGLSNELIRHIWIGSDKLIWLSTEKGVSIYSLDKKVNPISPNLPGAEKPGFFAFEIDQKGNVWLGTYNTGLWKYDPSSGEMSPYFQNNPEISKKINALYIEDQTLYIHHQIGLASLDLQSKQLKHLAKIDPSLLINEEFGFGSFVRDSTGKFWVSTANGLFLVHNDKAILFKPIPGDTTSIPDRMVTNVFLDRLNNVWAITDGQGLSKIVWNSSKNKYEFFTYSIADSGIPNVSSKVKSAAKLKDYFLLGTQNGLLLFDPINKVFFKDENLIPPISGGILAVAVDQDGKIWIPDSGDLLCYDPSTEVLARFDVKDGIINDMAEKIWINDKGLVALGGWSGFNLFDKSQLADNGEVKGVLITDIKILGKSIKVGENDKFLDKPILDRAISETDKIELSYQHRGLSLEFAVLDFSHQSEIQYKYMLEGFDPDWQTLFQERSINWARLEPGDYNFKVRAKNKAGTWSDTTTLAIHIEKPIWEKVWFIALILTMLVFFGKLVNEFRMRKIRSDRLKLEQLIEVRTQSLEISTQVEKQARADAEKAREEAIHANKTKSLFLANMSHEIRTPLNGIIGMVELLNDTELDQEQEEYVHTVHRSGESLLGVINDILDFSKIESGKLALEKVSFNIRRCVEEVVQLYVAKVSETQIKFIYSVDHRVPATIVADEIRFKQVLSNLVSNALKFTHDGYVKVFIGLEPDAVETRANSSFQLHVWIEDTGIGISEEKQKQLFQAFSQADNSITRRYGGTGLGLAICQKLCVLMGGNIEVSSQKDKGSTFHYWIETTTGEEVYGPVFKSFEEYHKQEIWINFENQVCTEAMEHTLKGIGMCTKSISPDSLPAKQENDVFCVIIDTNAWEKNKRLWLSWQKSQSYHVPFILWYGYGQEIPESTSTHFEGLVSYPLAYKAFTQNLLSLKRKEVKKEITHSQNIKLDRSFSSNYPLDILVAEDNPVNQKLIKRVLEKLGYQIRMVGNGKEAVEEAIKNTPDLIFMDIQMPDMDGVTASQIIQKDPSIHKAPIIIAITANAMKGDREKFFAAGMNDYVSKPFKIGDIKEILEKYSQKKHVENSLH